MSLLLLTAEEPYDRELHSLEDSTVTLSYSYSKEAVGNDYFFWYRQYPGKPPQLMICQLLILTKFFKATLPLHPPSAIASPESPHVKSVNSGDGSGCYKTLHQRVCTDADFRITCNAYCVRSL
uniref:Immunoglobulin V-set domain-containing protein n=1 Tax=Labrus bergylta TaxID=56723 RepID=A0A3Q3ENX2_9LABR